MSTPIGTMIFFVIQISEIMQKVAEASISAQIRQGIYYCQLLMSQLELMKTHVDDLLDLRMLKSGEFTILR